MESNRLKTKDIITVVLLSLINIVIFMSGTFLYATPITVLLMPIYYALLEGMVVFTIGVKVRKRGAMLIYCMIQGIVGFYLPYTLTYFLMGIISEIILSKTGYDNIKGLTVSYILQQVGLCFVSLCFCSQKDDGNDERKRVCQSKICYDTCGKFNNELGMDCFDDSYSSYSIYRFASGKESS